MSFKFLTFAGSFYNDISHDLPTFCWKIINVNTKKDKDRVYVTLDYGIEQDRQTVQFAKWKHVETLARLWQAFNISFPDFPDYKKEAMQVAKDYWKLKLMEERSIGMEYRIKAMEDIVWTQLKPAYDRDAFEKEVKIKKKDDI